MESTTPAPRQWDTRRREKARRMAAASHLADGPVLDSGRIVDALQLLLASGDRARATHDATVLSTALHWRAVTDWDPHPKVSVPGDRGTHHPSTFGWAIPYIAAVRAGDLPLLDRLLKDHRYNGNFHGYDPAAWDARTRAHFGVHAALTYPTWLGQ